MNPEVFFLLPGGLDSQLHKIEDSLAHSLETSKFMKLHEALHAGPPVIIGTVVLGVVDFVLTPVYAIPEVNKKFTFNGVKTLRVPQRFPTTKILWAAIRLYLDHVWHPDEAHRKEEIKALGEQVETLSRRIVSARSESERIALEAQYLQSYLEAKKKLEEWRRQQDEALPARPPG